MSFPGRFTRSEAGGIAILAAAVMPVLFGFAALAIEVGHWYLDGRAEQGAADASAMSAAASYLAGESNYTSVGQTFAARNGFTNGSNNVTVTVNPINAQNQIIVDIAQPQSPIFWPIPAHSTPLLCGSVPSTQLCIKAHAAVTLTATPASANGCLIGLSRSTTTSAIAISGNGAIFAPSCGVASNSCGGAAQNQCSVSGLGFSGNAQINVAELDVATQSAFACPAGTSGTTCKIATSKTVYPLWTADPFALFVMPSPGACTNPAPTTSLGVTTYHPGAYCNGISVSGQANVIFSPGLYFLVNSSFSITGGAVNQRTVASAAVVGQGNGAYKNNDVVTVSGGTAVASATLKLQVAGNKITGATVTGAGAYIAPVPANPVSVTGGKGSGATFNLTFDPDAGLGAVTFLLTGSTPGTATIKNAAVTLSAPSSGATQGLVFWQDKAATGGGASFNGNGQPTTSLTITGAFYFPSQTVSFSGNANFLPTQCTAVVASSISFQGNGTITKGCLPISTGGSGITGTFRLSQ